MFARAEAERSKEKVEEEAYDLGMAETHARPLSRLKFLGYAGFVVPRFGMRPLSKLG